jgi:hypothetical protein
MGFIVLPALVADISPVYDAYFAAFKDNEVTRAFFPSATKEDMTNPESEFRYVLSQSTSVLWCLVVSLVVRFPGQRHYGR